MHKRIVLQALKGLDAERAGYFSEMAKRLEENPRTSDISNLVFLCLRDVMVDVPIYLEKPNFEALFISFVEDNQIAIQRQIFDTRFVFDASILREVTGAFVNDVIARCVELYEAGEIASEERSVQKFTWPYRLTDLVDPEDEDELEEALKIEALYNGPERRKDRRS